MVKQETQNWERANMKAGKVAAKLAARPAVVGLKAMRWRVNKALLASGLSLAVLTLIGTAAQATLLLTEDFNYAAGTLLTANGWGAQSSAGYTPPTVASSGLTYSGYAQSGIGKAAQLNTSGEDDNKAIPSSPWTGSVYLAAMINLSAVGSGDFFLAFMNVAGSGDSSYCARLYVKTTTGGFLMGLAKGSGATPTYGAGAYSSNTTYLVVLKYTFNSGSSTDDTFALYVNPTLGDSEPAATVGPLSSATPLDFSVIGFVGLRQGTAGQAPTVQVDGIRVATTWVEAVAAACTTPATPTASNNGPVCSGTSLSLSTPMVTGATYDWTGPNGFTSSAQNPTVSTSATTAMAGTYNVTVTVNGCTSVAGRTVVTVNAVAATSAITGSNPVAIGQIGKIYSVAPTSGSSYAWAVPSGASITAGGTGPNNNQITVTFGSTGGDVAVTETTSGGCVGSPVALAVTVGPNHAPKALDKGYTRGKGMSLKIAKTDLMVGASDEDSADSVIYDGLVSMTSSQGVAVTEDSAYYFYLPINDNNDTLQYKVKDMQGGSATATISIQVEGQPGAASGEIHVSGDHVGVTMYGIPGVQYDVQRSTDLNSWTTLQTAPPLNATPPFNASMQDGSIDFTDNFIDLGGPPASAYYRIKQH